MAETFGYDALGRLTDHTLNSGSVNRTVSVVYNALGNILHKSDLGTYLCAASGPGAVRPHAVQTAAGTSYQYDPNGNLLGSTGAQARTHVWTSFTMRQSMGMAGRSMAWTYSAEFQRVEHTVADGATTRKTWLLHPDNAGGLSFEREHTYSGATLTKVENRHYIAALGGVVAVVKTYGENVGAAPPTGAGISAEVAKQTLYWHKDHLGSVVAVSDARGTLVERMAFDAWGARMQPGGTADPYNALNPSHGDRGDLPGSPVPSDGCGR
jgi:hypothetical protein